MHAAADGECRELRRECELHAQMRATLLQLHEPLIEVMSPTPDGDVVACDPSTTLAELCEGAELGDDNVLRLQYCVRTCEERKPSRPASEASAQRLAAEHAAAAEEARRAAKAAEKREVAERSRRLMLQSASQSAQARPPS